MKIESSTFEESQLVARRRLFSLEKRLNQYSGLRRLYKDFMSDYLNAGHMSELLSVPLGNDTYYIPQHPVVKMDGDHPKIRVVFDATAKAHNQLFLNNTLFVGHKLQADIVAILLHF